MTLVLRGLLREDVALEGLTALDGTARTHHEALRSALLGFHLRHDEQLRLLDGDGCAAGKMPQIRPSKPSPLVCGAQPESSGHAAFSGTTLRAPKRRSETCRYCLLETEGEAEVPRT